MMNQTYQDETGYSYPAEDFCGTTSTTRPYLPQTTTQPSATPPSSLPQQPTHQHSTDQQVWERVHSAHQAETTVPTAAVEQPYMTVQPDWANAAAMPQEQMYQSGQNGNPATPGMSSRFAQFQRNKNPLSMEQTMSPSDNREVYQSSLRSLLDRNIGYFISATFLLGTNQTVTWQGILHTVGSDFLVLYQPDSERYISCDFYALKFVQFYNTKNVPRPASDNNWQGRYGF